jgi:quinol monooxygenase YgiN
MSVPVLIGFAGVLVAAAATGMLAGRCLRRPRIDFAAWTAATLALTIALAAQSMGFATGFGSATFRAASLFALVLAPLWLAWGLIELVVASEAARFCARLVAGALTVVVSAILATDPLSAQPFSKAWPLTGPHFQPVSHHALDAVQAVAVVAVLASTVLASTVLASTGLASTGLARMGPARAMAAVVPVGLAALMAAGLRFALPAAAAYPLLSMLAAALVWFGASRVGEPAPEATSRGDGVGDGGNRYRGRPEDDGGPYGYLPDGQYVTYGQRGGMPGGGVGPPGPPDRYRVPGPEAPRGPGAGAEAAEPGAQSGPAGSAAAGSAAAGPARPYGRILIFTLLDDRVTDFDRLAEQTAEEVRTGEPDTLVYVIHLVPNAPLQRIFYEIYRDRAAFESHQNQPYMQRFVAERRSCVLATNVIELRLKYAKVAPLPSPQPAGTPPPLPGGPPPGGPLPGGPWARPQPPGRPQRPYQPRYERPDPRQVPSAGRRYEGG